MIAAAMEEARPAAKPKRAPPLWLLPVLALVAIQMSEIAKANGGIFAEMTDPDTLMRLARIQYALAGHGWQGGLFPRDNAPYGMVLHWSILFDLPILALAGALSLAVPFSTALSLAGALTGPLVAYGILWAAWWVPAPLLSRRGQELACLVALLSPPILAYGAVGRANHHVALALMAMILAGFVLRAWRRPGQLAPAAAGGLAAAISLWLSFELLAIAILPALIVMGLLWVREGGRRIVQNLAFALAFALAASAALAIDPPHGGMGTFLLDRLSAPYVAFAWAVCGTWAILALADRDRPLARWPRRAAAAAAVAALAAAALIFVYPAILAGVNGSIDPLVQQELNAKVEETQPSWGHLKPFLEFAFVGCLGFLASAVMAWRERGGDNAFGQAILLALAATMTGLGLAHIRFTPYAYLAAAFLLAGLVDHGRSAWPGRLGRYLRLIVLILGLGVPFLATFLPERDAGDSRPAGAMPCSVFALRNVLSDPAWGGPPSAIVATAPDEAPALLYWTPHQTLFGPYHRNAAGLRDLLALFRDTGDDAARRIVAARGIGGFLVCASEPANMFMTADVVPADTLYKRLVEGRPPAWLEQRPWPQGIPSGYRFYRVVGNPG